MIIYGVAVLAACLLVGTILGDALGALLGVDANIGGVGFAMILLIVGTDMLRRRGHFPPHTADGVLFWSAMYIPIVVAMATTQNVVSAVRGAGRRAVPVLRHLPVVRRGRAGGAGLRLFRRGQHDHAGGRGRDVYRRAGDRDGAWRVQ